jgi:tetratricopeptide (TPR) repeat protein
MALGLLHRYDEAEADLNHAIQLDPDFRPARLNRGVIYQMQGKRDAALADFAAVLQPPEDRMLIEAAYYRSQLYIDSGDYDDALTDLDSVILAKKDFYPAYLLRARVHLLQGARDASLQDLAAELRQSTGGAFDPDSAKDLGQRGSMLRHIAAELPGDAARITLDLARADLQTAVQSGGRSASVYADLGAVLDLLGQTNESIQAYSSALQLDPADVQVRINRGWAYQKSGQLDPAGADFAAAIQSDPTNAEAYTGLGYIRASQKDYDSARAQAVRALLYGSNDYLILHNVACIYAVMSDTDTIHQTDDQDLAISMLQRAVGFWRDGKRGPDEVRLIEQEPAFPPALRARPEFQQLLTTAAPTTPP